MDAAGLSGHGVVVGSAQGGIDGFGQRPALSPQGDGDPPKGARGRSKADQTSSLFGVRVLVVEDESLVAMDLVVTLEELGADVCGTAASSDEAVRRARTLRPELAVVDIRLRDGETGVDAARVMAEELGMAIVFATAHTNSRLALRMADVPGAGRLTKPYDSAELLDAVRHVLRRH